MNKALTTIFALPVVTLVLTLSFNMDALSSPASPDVHTTSTSFENSSGNEFFSFPYSLMSWTGRWIRNYPTVYQCHRAMSNNPGTYCIDNRTGDPV